MRVLLVNDLPTDDPERGGAEVYVGRLTTSSGTDSPLFFCLLALPA